MIVQAGVGSLAGALAAWLVARFGAGGPALAVAEPEGSACVLGSFRAGARRTLDACASTAMVGLRCGEVSALAWPAPRDRIDAAVAVPESVNDAAMKRLAIPAPGDPVITAGASGSCGLAAHMILLGHREFEPMRRGLGVSSASRFFVLVTEGRTDE